VVERGGTTKRLAGAIAGLALALAVSACAGASPSATPSGGSSQPSLTASPPTLAPVTRSISGTATVATTGVPVAGVRIHGSSLDPQGQPASPEVTAVTDARGAYTLSFPTWPGGNPPALFVTLELPPGYLLVEMTNFSCFNPGCLPTQGMSPTGDLGDGPIDITLARLGFVVEGSVTSGLTGAPLAGVQVSALGLISILIYGGVGDAAEVAAMTSTDATGRYSLTVPSGSYVIYAQGPEGSQQRFWSQDPTVFQATPLNVDQGFVGIDIALVPVTAIGGEVRSGPTQITDAVAGIRVVAYLAGDTPCCRIGGVGVTGEQGFFLMYVPQGPYRIAFEPPPGSPYAQEWWNGAAGFATATDVTLASEPVQLEAELAPVSP
jgi:hypothetical protein